MTAALPMGGQKITGMADPTVTTDAATKNYVDTLTTTFFSTGDVKFTLKTAPDAGWLLFDDGTFGSATSGSSNRANADTQTLFNLFYNTAALNDTVAPLFTSAGVLTSRAAQGSASAAWGANCRMSLTKTLGRAIGVAGSGAALTARGLGSTVGLETATLVTVNLPPYTPTGTTAFPGGSVSSGSFNAAVGAGSTLLNQSSVGGAFGAPTFTGAAQGGTSTPVAIMDPTTYLNAMVKL